ncbi:MAG: hypothetical protein K8R77_05195 [Anaerolineaceae bacterium]|nr:hypothetical protein [Anaerolineaceae bacterium]
MMKQLLVTILILVLVSGCSNSCEPTPSPVAEAPQETDSVLTAAAFNQIKDHILAQGDRQTYCNMFNNNPHVTLGNMDIYLNPDTGQQNINCDLKLSEFNHMVIRTREPWKYYRVQLNLKATGPDLILQEGTNPEELSERFQEALSALNDKKNR